MSSQPTVKPARPGFGKRGSVRVKPAVRKPESAGRLTQMFGRWWGKKEAPKRLAQKGFGSRR
jgi:hypothetical protein